jgi:hypothetical protein
MATGSASHGTSSDAIGSEMATLSRNGEVVEADAAGLKPGTVSKTKMENKGL